MWLAEPLNLNSRKTVGDDIFIGPIKEALERWSDMWTATCNAVPPKVWPMLGFFKNSYRFCVVARWMVSKHDKFDVALLMPKVEDKLERMRTIA